MHELEPYYRWRDEYISEEDGQSPFFGREYSEFEYNLMVYNYYIHPQWDAFGPENLYMKILAVDYDDGYCIMEFIGEWNDCITNDIMYLKRDIVEPLIAAGITKFMLIGENVLNFHASDDCYYEEWFQEVEDGWIVAINFREHILEEFKNSRIDYYVNFGGSLDTLPWRNLRPKQLYEQISFELSRRLS